MEIGYECWRNRHRFFDDMIEIIDIVLNKLSLFLFFVIILIDNHNFIIIPKNFKKTTIKLSKFIMVIGLGTSCNTVCKRKKLQNSGPTWNIIGPTPSQVVPNQSHRMEELIRIYSNFYVSFQK